MRGHGFRSPEKAGLLTMALLYHDGAVMSIVFQKYCIKIYVYVGCDRDKMGKTAVFGKVSF